MSETVLRFVQTGDWHLGMDWSRYPRQVNRKLAGAELELHNLLLYVVKKHQADIVFLTGDIFEDALPEEYYLGDFVEMVKRLAPIPVVVAPGDHDPILPGHQWLGVEWPENFYCLTGNQNCIEFESLRCRVCGLAFEHETDTAPVRLSAFDTADGYFFNIAVMHAALDTSESWARPVTRDDLSEGDFDYIALGGQNKSRIEADFQPPFAFAGSPLGRGFDSCGSAQFIAGELRGKLTSGNLTNLDLITRKQMKMGNRAEVSLIPYPLPLPSFRKVSLFCEAKWDMKALLKNLEIILNNELRDGGSADDLWRIYLQGIWSKSVRSAELRDTLVKRLSYVELIDERLARDVPLEDRVFLFPSLDLSKSFPGFDERPANPLDMQPTVEQVAADSLIRAVSYVSGNGGVPSAAGKDSSALDKR